MGLCRTSHSVLQTVLYATQTKVFIEMTASDAVPRDQFNYATMNSPMQGALSNDTIVIVIHNPYSTLAMIARQVGYDGIETFKVI